MEHFIIKVAEHFDIDENSLTDWLVERATAFDDMGRAILEFGDFRVEISMFEDLSTLSRNMFLHKRGNPLKPDSAFLNFEFTFGPDEECLYNFYYGKTEVMADIHIQMSADCNTCSSEWHSLSPALKSYFVPDLHEKALDKRERKAYKYLVECRGQFDKLIKELQAIGLPKPTSR